MTVNAKIGGLLIFLAILGCDTGRYHSQGGATELSLCDPDREFGICILTKREHPVAYLGFGKEGPWRAHRARAYNGGQSPWSGGRGAKPP